MSQTSENAQSLQNSYWKFRHTPDSSVVDYLSFLATELKDKAEATGDKNEKLWYYDASSLVAEVMCRFDECRIRNDRRANILPSER